MTTLSSLTIEELLYLCSATGSVEAWEEFVRRFHRLIATVVLRTAGRLGDSSRQTVDDLIQETYLKLCADKFRILQNFHQHRPDGFLGYIKVVTANVVRDHFKTLRSDRRGANRIEPMAEQFAPATREGSSGSAKAMERAVLIGQVQKHLDLCIAGPEEARNRRVFWLYYRAGLSARAIADLPGIGLTTKGVESLLVRITRDLRGRMVEPKQEEASETPGPREGILPAQSL